MSLHHHSSFGVLLLAGSGTRYNPDIPKQFTEYNGRPLFCHALESLANHEEISSIICVIRKKDADLVRDIVTKMNLAKPLYLVEGGSTRSESVHNAVRFLGANGACENSIVLLHDAARPYLKADYIHKTISKAKESGSAIIAHPSSDSIALGDGIRLNRYLERSSVYIIGTPQAFRLSLLNEAFEKKDPDVSYGDEGSMLLDVLSISPSIVRDGSENIKITFPEDGRI